MGSHENFRGKSTVLETALWALRGRCGLQADVRQMIRRVELDLVVDAEPLRIAFDVIGDQPRGAVNRLGTPDLQLVSFVTHAQFESAMSEIMMPRLGLTPIPAWQSSPGSGPEGQSVSHSWAVYAGALFIADASLEDLLGDTSFSGLPGRLLHMFVGTPWATTMVEAQVAARQTKQELDAVQRRASGDAAARASERENLAAQLTVARIHLDQLPDAPSADAIAALVEAASNAGADLASIRSAHQAAVTEAKALKAEHKAAQARRLDFVEDALARKFFNSIAPTACPRCTAPVTPERVRSERDTLSCSVCTTGLDIEALADDVIVASVLPADQRADVRHAASLALADQADVDDEDVSASTQVDELQALAQAVVRSEQRRETLAGQLASATHAFVTAKASLAATNDARAAAHDRQTAALAVARLEGALEQAERAAGLTDDGSATELQRRHAILQNAEALARTRVTAGQQALLAAVGEEIVRLGRLFGIDALDKVVLRGNATLEVHKGGVQTYYGRCTRGEKLRLKVATAVALLRVGSTTGVGRHPGLLLVDSPGAEEATQENLDAMLIALRDVAADVSHLQVLVATRSPQVLEQLLD